MLTAEIRVNGRLVGLIEILNDGIAFAVTEGELSNYDVTVHDFQERTQTTGKVEDFDRQDGPLALVREALRVA